jgi:hypothetical protein
MNLLNVLAAVFLVIVVIASVVAQDYSIFSWAYWQEGGSASRSEVVRNLGLLAAGVIGLGFGIWRAYTAYRQTQASQGQAEAANEQARIAEQGHITDRFSTAVEHLGSTQLPVRLGGIYALWRLIEDSPKRDVTSVIDILCAFVRNPPHEPAEPEEEEDDAAPIKEIRPDAQTVLKLIGAEAAKYRHHLPGDYHLDLTYAHLVLADLIRADLTGANLRGTVLTHADLTLAILQGVDLTYAHLADADLTGADLRGAIVARTHPRGADVDAGGHLRDITANLIFEDADLTGADLTDVKNLTQFQVDKARCDPEDPPVLPPGLTPPRRSPKRKS